LGSLRDVRIVLLGDSHLARIKRDLPRLGQNVFNAAVGGATIHDIDAQAAAASVGHDDVLVLSIGTNDSAPRQAVPLGVFAEALDRFLGWWDVRRWVIILPPGVDESRLDSAGDRTNSLLSEYRAAEIGAAATVDARLVDSRAVLLPLGSRAFAQDGLHLSGKGYRVLLPALAIASEMPSCRS
jgi:lysophospholipase L1-like esterase